MAVDVAQIVGADNMDAAKKDIVIGLLHNLPTDATTKRFLYTRWARLVNIVPDSKDIDAVALWQQ